MRRRLTNKKIIGILLPILKKALAGELPDGKVGEVGGIGWLKVERIEEGELIYVGVTLNFYDGKYGRATLATKVRKSDNTPVVGWLGYEKTFRGTASGFLRQWIGAGAFWIESGIRACLPQAGGFSFLWS